MAHLNGRQNFHDRPEKASKEVYQRLRRAVINDARPSDTELIKFGFFYKYTVCIMNLIQCVPQFSEMYKNAVLDLDMKDDLERSKVINWCRTAKPLYPMKTTGDGNCLLHAVSLALWGMEDTDQFLRRLLYLNITTDERGMFKKRWLANQKHTVQAQRFDIIIHTCEMEWESVIKATQDIMSEGSHALPYTTLESIHLYVLANILRRPIIVLADRIARNVYGQSLQESEIGGLYLPLESRPVDCHKNPIVIGYNMNHFAPLVFEENDFSMADSMQVVPLIANELNSLPVHYLLPNEESKAQRHLMEYMEVKEVVYTGSDGPLAIPTVQVKHEPLPGELNIMEAYRRDCEQMYLRLTGQDVTQGRQPFNFQQRVITQNIAGNTHINILPNNALNIIQGNVVIGPSNHEKRNAPQKEKKCLGMGCKMFGSQETGGYCSKCFKRGTIQYHRQEERDRQAKQKQERQALLPFNAGNQHRQNNGFHDISIMGEDCHAGCGFKCSTETYPYCHECYPKYPQGLPGTTTTHIQVEQQVPVAGNQAQEEVQLSMLPDSCINADCQFRCSVATRPYCHQCFDNVLLSQRNADPTAPPPSLPQAACATQPNIGVGGYTQTQQQVGSPVQRNEPRRQLTIQPQEKNQNNINETLNGEVTSPPRVIYDPMETGEVGEGLLSKKCKMLDCRNNAVRGNDGMCDTCYSASLYGPGIGASPPTSDRNLTNPIQQKQEGICISPNCKVKAKPGFEHCAKCFLEDGKVPSSREPIQSSHMPMNIGVPNIDEKIFKSEEIMNPYVAGVPQPGMEVSSAKELQTQRQAKFRMKHDCVTEGCQGTYNENEFGLCSDCYAKVRENSDLEMSDPFPSCSPVVLSDQEVKKLNPVVVSSRQKTECISPFCTVMIYPPNIYCEDCLGALQKSTAKKAIEDNKPKATTDKQTRCKTDGCQFFGNPELNGYCSHCSKSKVSNRSPVTGRLNSAPIMGPPNRLLEGVNPMPKCATAPLADRQGKYCVVTSCKRYGDPSQSDRCSQHYIEAKNPIPIDQIGRILGQGNTSNTTGQTVSLHQVTVLPAQQGAASGTNAVDPFIQSFSKVEGNLKTKMLCKNNLSTGCQNFGNARNRGYCNSCYPDIHRKELNLQMAIAGGNMFG